MRISDWSSDVCSSDLVRDDSGIKDVAGLKGHTLASQKEGSTADTVLKGVVLKDAGLKPDDLSIMGVSPQVAVQSLVGKRVDAAFLFEPQARIAQLIAPVTQIYEVRSAEHTSELQSIMSLSYAVFCLKKK